MKKELNKLFRTFLMGLAITGCSPTPKSPQPYETNGCVNEHGYYLQVNAADPRNPDYHCLGGFILDGQTSVNFFGNYWKYCFHLLSSPHLRILFHFPPLSTPGVECY